MDIALINPIRPRDFPICKMPDLGGPDAAFAVTIDRSQRAEFATRLFRARRIQGQRPIAPVLAAAALRGPGVHEGSVAEGHIFDEADGQPARKGQAREIGQFVVIDPAHRYTVDLQ